MPHVSSMTLDAKTTQETLGKGEPDWEQVAAVDEETLPGGGMSWTRLAEVP